MKNQRNVAICQNRGVRIFNYEWFIRNAKFQNTLINVSNLVLFLLLKWLI